MNFLKNIFARKQVQTAAAEESKPISYEDVRIIVPEPEVTHNAFPTVSDSCNSFNVVKHQEETGLYFRLTSDGSSEIMRLNCTVHNYEFADLRRLMTPEMKKDRFEYEMPYVKIENCWHFIARVFVTSKRRFFYQIIRPDGPCGYRLVDQKWLQNIVKTCESNEDVKIFLMNNNDSCKWVSKPGTFTIEDFERSILKRDNVETIDSYEIIDNKLYDEIIEVF